MPFVPDNHPELNALLEGALEVEAECGEPEHGERAEDRASAVDWLVLADWLDDHSDPRADLLRMVVSGDSIGQRYWIDRQVPRWLGKLPRGVKVTPRSSAPGLELSLSEKAQVPEPLAAAAAAGWLAISQCNLSLHLPRLPGLRRLRLVAGSIDDDLASLADHPTLTALELNNSHGFSPTGFRHLARSAQLNSLEIDRAPWLTDDDLQVLENCSRLRILRLRRCHALTGSGPGRLPKLRVLRFRTCSGLTAAGLSKLAPLKNLERLKIDSDISGSVAAGLPELPSLLVLDLSGNSRLNDAGLKCLSRLPRLERLLLMGAFRLTGSGLDKLVEPTILKSLHLTGARVEGNDFAPLARCTGLVDLNLRWCWGPNDDNLNCVAGLKDLKSLSLAGARSLTGSGLAHLRDAGTLEKLDLSNCRELTDANLAHLAPLSSLRALNLAFCGRLTGSGLASLAGLAHIETLRLEYCDELTPDGLKSLAKLINLRALNLSNRGRLGDEALAALAPLRKMQRLELSGWELLTAAGLAALANLRGLLRLDLSGCAKVTDAGLAHLTGMTSLQELRLGGTLVTASSADHLVRLTGLRSLSLDMRRRLDLGPLARLAELPHLRSLWMGSPGYGKELDQLRAQLPNCNVWGW